MTTTGTHPYALLDISARIGTKAHDRMGQTYDGKSYSTHLAAVESVLREFGANEEQHLDMLCAAWLHDTLEDTKLTPDDIRLALGNDAIVDDIMELVEAVTLNQVASSRGLALRLTLPRIRQNPRAVMLKLADRIANVRASHKSGPHYWRYVDEYPMFRVVLHREGEFEAMWHELDSLLGWLTASVKIR